MKRFTWGHGIVIFFILYIGYLVGTVIKAQSINHYLVEDDYYAHDIAYQEMYVDARTNRTALSSDLSVDLTPDARHIQLKFGASTKNVKVKAHFYRPSDKKMDRKYTFDLEPSESTISIESEDLVPGKWIVKVRWEDGQKTYYKEQVLII